ncbi:KH domain-containing protein [Patescibacteria group bacterium]|nr:KH domain-containing protein [Patescibacteria group bacterium]MBU1256517.1 KH domain-containing protein [Patescibacteria group bacterium]MBU1457309.1 KH domain-containing protein [Patescibacteria group bacterium]
MKQLVEYIVSNLVNHPEDVVIEEEKTPGEEDSSNIIIQVNPEDIGRVIGRSGKVINAIRQIARIAAIQKGVRVRVDLKDDGQPQPQVQEAPTLEE